MQENLKDLESLMEMKHPPVLKRDPQTHAITIQNKEMCKDIKDLEKKVKALEKQQQEFRQRVSRLQAELKRSFNLTKYINDVMVREHGTKSK